MINRLLEKYKTYGFKTTLVYSWTELKAKIWWSMINGSYSQFQEDILIDKELKKKNGFYVDIGANDPSRFSNTYRFYKNGWSGVAIEPDKKNFDKLQALRSRDININVGVGRQESEIKFYVFEPDTLSTFSQKSAEEYQRQGFKLTEEVTIPVSRLDKILTEVCSNKHIDFMSIDTEGFDVEVLESNDWNKFRPTLICIEKSDEAIESILNQNNYNKIAETKVNAIYKAK